MSTTPETYTIICAILGETTAFSVKIANNEIVDQLKDAIKEERPNRFAGVDATKLTLYRVDVAAEDDMMKNVEKKMSETLPALNPTYELTEIYPTAPPKKTIHIIVSDPKSDKELKTQKPIDPEVVKFVDAVKFFTTTVGEYTVADLVNSSNNTHLHKGALVTSTYFPDDSLPDNHQTPSFVSEYVEKLDEKRPASQTQLQQLQRHTDIFDQTVCEAHFEVVDSEEQEMSFIELDTYTAYLRCHHHRLSWIIENGSSPFKDGHLTVHLVDPALTADNKSWCYNKDVAWDPLLLQGTIADHEVLYKFKPRSDFSLFKTTYGPLIMGEIVSNKGESDRWRMLFEGIAVCRYQNMIRGDRKAITLCLYLNTAYEMERYLVYQDIDPNQRDVHILHDLTLNLTKTQDTFLLSKQLFNFRQRLIQIPEDKVRDRQNELKIIEEEIKTMYSTSVTAAKKLKSEAGRLSRAPAGTLGPVSEDAVLQASFKAIHVLNHNQKDVATAIRRSDLQSVVLKRIRTNSSELHIVRLLQSYTSRGSTHIIPLLDVVERPPGISTLVMPYYTPILDLEKGRVEDLALQLIRGVDWLHRRLISHSDIKERNMVFDEKQNRLYIIDFGLAVKLTSREQKVRGARGTPEHVAPEVGITSSWENYLEEVFLDEESIYSPILADVWAVGDVINHFQKRFRSSTESIRMVVENAAKELQAVNPIKRLLLQEAERRIVTECSMASTAPGPPATSHWIEGGDLDSQQTPNKSTQALSSPK